MALGMELKMELGPVMLDVAGTALASSERERLRHPLVGGVILFSRNFESVAQLEELVAAIRAARPGILISVDHEGGRVQRFRTGFTRLPAAAVFGEIYDRDPAAARRHAETCGWLMARELRAVGIDFSFAPVLDLNRGVSKVIGDRAFHRQATIVAALAQAYTDGMARAGMPATGKHFPGHGAVEADSHVAAPVDTREFAEIEQDLIPFRRLIEHGLAAVMPAHVVFTRVDAQPAGFSRVWLQDILRERLHFHGVVFSDDLSMEGAKVAGGVLDRAHAALGAGCDMILVCNDPGAAETVLAGLGRYRNPASAERLARMRGRGAGNWRSMLAENEYREAVATVAGLVPVV